MTENTKGEKVQYLIFTMLLAVLVIGFAGTAKAERIGTTAGMNQVQDYKR